MKKQVLKLIFTAVLLSVFGSTFSAQTMNEDFRKKAPEPLKSVPFNISKPFETTLDNGLKVVIVENDRLPIVSYRLAFLSGTADEPRDSVGRYVGDNFAAQRRHEKSQRANRSPTKSNVWARAFRRSAGTDNTDLLRLRRCLFTAMTL